MSEATEVSVVRVEHIRDGAATLRLARPERRNAIDTAMADQIQDALAEMRERGVRVGVIEAEGPAFCAGADLGDIETSGLAVDLVLDLLTASEIHWTAVVRGAVRGAGMGILAVCPRVVATPEATFGLPEIAKGFFPTALIDAQASALGGRAAFELAFSGDPMDAATARALGLVSEVLPATELDEAVVTWVDRLVGRDPEAVLSGVRLWSSWFRRHLVPEL